MITKEELEKITRTGNLNLYQQEKDYLLKTFLYNYYKRFDNAIFKGGTCIKYLYGLDRFSEDLDFNLKNTPKKFKKEVEETLKEIGRLGITNNFKKEETFEDAYTCEINFQGPLSVEGKTRNKFRIDAGKRTGTIRKPKWGLIRSEYPETPQNFLILTMEEQEMLAEKMITLVERNKGRDIYDTWFLLKKGVKIDQKLIEKKSQTKDTLKRIEEGKFPAKQEYERDMKRLTTRVIPYDQMIQEIRENINKSIRKTP
ncbi:MAG: nucleotidyl transferase AbiEii/AbiGii toxin family protein [Candidatus Altiarchaeota archaeon]